jgi:hypothetical protein
LKLSLDVDFLKYLVANGSLFEAAVALAVLDKMTDGKVTEFAERYVNAPSPSGGWPVQVRRGGKAKVRR